MIETLILANHEAFYGHEKHENPAAGKALKAPIGARKTSSCLAKGSWCFLWPKPLGLGVWFRLRRVGMLYDRRPKKRHSLRAVTAN